MHDRLEPCNTSVHIDTSHLRLRACSCGSAHTLLRKVGVLADLRNSKSC
jgi:hypothetical protein